MFPEVDFSGRATNNGSARVSVLEEIPTADFD
jgi:hypothetical protein